MRRRSVALVAATACLALCADAQTAPAKSPASLEVTMAWSADRTNGLVGGCGCFWMSGGKAEANVSFPHRVSIVAELAGQHSSNVGSTHQDLNLVSYLFGPRYNWRAPGRLAPFAQFLVGGVHGFGSSFPTTNGSNLVPDAFAFASGGGLNINISRHFALRAVQADYVQTQLPNDANDRQNHLRLSAGIIFRVGGRP